MEQSSTKLKLATFAGGCFWCLEPPFENVVGISKITAGYSNGKTTNPTYEAVCHGNTGHIEAIQIEYDETKVSYSELLDIFWRQIDPTDEGGQFADRGDSYKTCVFYHDETQHKLAKESAIKVKEDFGFAKIATKIIPFKNFYPAEEQHQMYYKKNPFHYSMYKKGSGRSDFIERTYN